MSYLTSPIIVVLIAACSCISVIIQLKSFNYSDDAHVMHETGNYTLIPANDSLILDDKHEHVFIFMQVTDLHLSINFDPSRGPDFEILCTTVLDTIKPAVTLVTGDLTDARTRRLMAGEQFESEWQQYYDILLRTAAGNKTLWLDIRGNHDAFGVYSSDGPTNYFAKYSIRGKHHKSHYSYIVKSAGDTYAFIAVDACLSPGPNRPFNTVGLLHKADIDALRNMRQNVTDHINMTIWFGHYPTRAITGPSPGLSDIIDGPYLSGHVHMTDLYALQSQGFLDIELADWRAKRKFRVAAIDHSIFSFSDVILNEWPVILITNPKAAAFQMPAFEPVHRIRTSTHIRVLVYSPSEIMFVNYKINTGDWVSMRKVPGSALYVAPWDPSQYPHDLQMIHVRASDMDGNERTASHQFSFDGSRPDFGLRSKLIMTYPHQTSWAIGFFAAVLVAVVPLAVARVYDMFSASRNFRIRFQQPMSCFVSSFAKVYLLTCVDKLFIPVICTPLYLTFGPWLYGRVIVGHYATCFVWGMIIEGSFLPGGVSYVLGMVFVLLVHVPFTLCLSHVVHCRYMQLTGDLNQEGECRRMFHCRHLIACAILMLHFVFSLLYGDGYGVVAWIFGFAHTWTLFMNAFLWYQAMNLQLSDFRPMQRGYRNRTAGHDNDDVIEHHPNEVSELVKERTD